MIEGIMVDKQVLFILGFPIWIVVRAIVLIITRKNRGSLSLLREFLIGILAVYIFYLIGVTLFPIYVQFASRFRTDYFAFNIIPFKEIGRQVFCLQGQGFSFGFRVELMLQNVGGNLILLAPLGFLLPVLWKRFRNFKECFMFGIFTSVTIEILQLIESLACIGLGRVTDIDDVILNTIGVAVGFWAFKALYRLYNRYKSKSYQVIQNEQI